jgi:hypothetical protein
VGGAPIFAAYVFHPGTKGVFFIKRTKEGVKQVLKDLYYDLEGKPLTQDAPAIKAAILAKLIAAAGSRQQRGCCYDVG